MAAVAPAVAFRAALQRIGFNVATQNAINENGFDTIVDLVSVSEADLDRLPKHLESWRDPDLDPEDQVRVPFVSLKRLKAMRYWVLSQRWLGVEPAAANFTAQVLTDTMQRMQDNKDFKTATEDSEVTKPIAFAEMAKWSKFWELFMTYLGRVRGAAEVPLRYLIREQAEVTDTIREAAYDSMEERLIATTVHTGSHYALDNRTLYDELKPLVIDGPGWGFIKQFDKTKDGRSAVLALKSQAEGLAAKLTRKMKAYSSIKQSVYRGPRRGFTFDSYVSLHQEAHNELLDLEEPVSELKKVTDFLKGIQDPELKAGKVAVLGDPTKLGSFQETQQFLKTLVHTMQQQSKLERHVSSVTKSGGRGAGGGGGSLVDKIKGGSYSRKQFNSLTQEEKDRVAKYRAEANKKKRSKKHEKEKKRKLAKAQSEQSDDAEGGDSGDDEPPSANAGAQFGSNGNKSKKTKSPRS